MTVVSPVVYSALLASFCLPYARAQDPSANVKDIVTFVACLNNVLPKAAKQPATIAETAMCVPRGCKLTGTMSSESAQAACSLGGCQLPRIIFSCPDNGENLRFRPSFLLCPVDNKTGDIFGVDRIEAARDTMKVEDDKGIQRMADIPVPPTTDFTKAGAKIDANRVISSFGNNKKCNTCHESALPKATKAGDPILSMPIDTFSKEFSVTDSNINTPANTKVDLSKRIILTTEPGKEAKPDAKGTDGNPLVAQNLKQVCDCIEKNAAKIKADANDEAVLRKAGFVTDKILLKDVANPNLDPQILLNLCRAIQPYPDTRACGHATNKRGIALACAGIRGGGKFLSASNAVSALVFDLSGQAQEIHANAFTFADWEGPFSAYDYASRTVIDPVVISSFAVTRSSPSPSADLAVTGTGLASVNGSQTKIEFTINRTSGVLTYQITDSNTGIVLAGGTGEAGRAAVDFTVTGP